jgi:hypothetical protein
MILKIFSQNGAIKLAILTQITATLGAKNLDMIF